MTRRGRRRRQQRRRLARRARRQAARCRSRRRGPAGRRRIPGIRELRPEPGRVPAHEAVVGLGGDIEAQGRGSGRGALPAARPLRILRRAGFTPRARWVRPGPGNHVRSTRLGAARPGGVDVERERARDRRGDAPDPCSLDLPDPNGLRSRRSRSRLECFVIMTPSASSPRGPLSAEYAPRGRVAHDEVRSVLGDHGPPGGRRTRSNNARGAVSLRSPPGFPGLEPDLHAAHSLG